MAQKFNCPIVSADSRQFYKEISIGTAKPSVEERKGVPHHFIDCYSIHEEITAATYAKEATKLLEQEFSINNYVILTGGSGMFIDALCLGLDDIPSNKALRDEIYASYETAGLQLLLDELKSKDLYTYETIDKQNPARVIRAIEAIRLSGKPMSELKGKNDHTLPYKVIRFVLNYPREQLYERINLRVDTMMNEGLLEEVKHVYPFRNLGPLRTVGYRELFEFLDGKCSLEFAVDKIKQNTRNYAKRQITYFKRHKDAYWLDCGNPDEMLAHILTHLT